MVTLLSDDYKASKNSVEWKSIKGMRNVVAHKYGKFDFDVLCETVTEDIPKLKAFCESELGSESNQNLYLHPYIITVMVFNFRRLS